MEDRHEHQRVAQIAYQLWLERGCPGGSPDDDWFRAERTLQFSLVAEATGAEQETAQVPVDAVEHSPVNPPPEAGAPGQARSRRKQDENALRS